MKRPSYIAIDGTLDVKAIRVHVSKELGMREPMTQAKFAELAGVSFSAVQEWEYGRRTPSGPAHTLLLVVARYPLAVKEIVEERWKTRC